MTLSGTMKNAFVLWVALAVAGCSDDSSTSPEPGASGSGGGGTAGSSASSGGSNATGNGKAGASGSDSGSKIPGEGGLRVELSQSANRPSGTACNAAGQTQTFGDPPPGATSPGTAVISGESGVTISCSVAGDGTLTVEGLIQNEMVAFSMFAELAPNEKASGIVKLVTPEAGALVDRECEFVPIDLTQGAAWLSFDCALTAEPDVHCGAQGYVTFQNCAK